MASEVLRTSATSSGSHPNSTASRWRTFSFRGWRICHIV